VRPAGEPDAALPAGVVPGSPTVTLIEPPEALLTSRITPRSPMSLARDGVGGVDGDPGDGAASGLERAHGQERHGCLLASRIDGMGTNLLTWLASLPPERMAEGEQVDVEFVDGRKMTITFGKRVPAPDESAAFAITPPRAG
jgi:hypothetical protein